MAREKPGQEAMFVQSAGTGDEFVRAIDLPPDPNPGPSVELAHRAEALLRASIVLGKLSQRLSFKELMDGPLGPYVAIMREEKDDLVPLDEKVTVATLRAELRFHFEDLYGLDAMIESDACDNHSASDMAAQDYVEYVIAFGRSVNAERREAHRKQIKKNARNYR